VRANLFPKLIQFAQAAGWRTIILQSTEFLTACLGLPDPEYFPFSSVSSETCPFAESKTIIIRNEAIATEDFGLSTALQYGPVTGLPQLIEFQTNLSSKGEGMDAHILFISHVYAVFQPAYDNFTTLIHTGNTDGYITARTTILDYTDHHIIYSWNRCVMTLLNKGEGILIDEWTYPAALATATPLGVSPVPIVIDGQGMRSDHLRQVLSEWDENARRMPRPHVIYIIPVGQVIT
jgi:aromatic amino acid aminotransferase I / 2-aminoadipate transaminase